jgi:CRP-like cAMP-binding protein
MTSNDNALEALAPIQDDDRIRRQIGAHLKRMPFFAGFDDDEIGSLAASMRAYRADTGDAVFIESQQAGYMCVVIEGKLDIIKETARGNSRKINTVEAGKLIGEMSLIDGLPHSATAIAAQPSLLAALTGEALAQLTSSNPRLGAKLYHKIAELLSSRLRKTDAELAKRLD